MDTTLETALEQLVDANSLSAVVDALQSVAYAKAEHLESNWQDRQAAKHWLRAARALDGCRGFSI
jgi:hypothetical protein